MSTWVTTSAATSASTSTSYTHTYTSTASAAKYYAWTPSYVVPYPKKEYMNVQFDKEKLDALQKNLGASIKIFQEQMQVFIISNIATSLQDSFALASKNIKKYHVPKLDHELTPEFIKFIAETLTTLTLDFQTRAEIFNAAEVAKKEQQEELIRQKDKISYEIHLDEWKTAQVFLSYYRNMALQKTAPVIPEDQLLHVSKFLAGTLSCELRHRLSRCNGFWSKAWHLWTLLQDWNLGRNLDRQGAASIFYLKTGDWDCYMIEQYLRLSAYIFNGEWEGGYGNYPWASTAWFACEWVKGIIAGKGVAPVMNWEKMLNAAHNGARWLNKLGTGIVLGVLNLGANADASTIVQVADAAFRANSSREFHNVILQWCGREIPGQKTKLILPDSGFLVSTILAKSCRTSISKAKTAEALTEALIKYALLFPLTHEKNVAAKNSSGVNCLHTQTITCGDCEEDGGECGCEGECECVEACEEECNTSEIPGDTFTIVMSDISGPSPTKKIVGDSAFTSDEIADEKRTA